MPSATTQPIRIVEAPQPELDERTRRMLMTRRQALIIELGGIEDYLGVERSIIPKRKRPEELARKFDRIMTGRQ